VAVPQLLEVTKHIDLRVPLIFWKNLVLVGAAVAVVAGLAVAAAEARLMA